MSIQTSTGLRKVQLSLFVDTVESILLEVTSNPSGRVGSGGGIAYHGHDFDP